jgi:hypothetical protein
MAVYELAAAVKQRILQHDAALVPAEAPPLSSQR